MSVAQEPVNIRGERVKAIYARDIRDKVEPAFHGKLIAIDANSGDYEIDDVGGLASVRLCDRRPDADVFILRIGFPTAVRIGGFALPGSP